ncbi:DUF4112 domain-containing protein [Pelagicoccus sp. SDUM812002]|uniref:DUF4112 domain-containing protein n=1 Tax=Pelagicoccus sp. SDUM812002 TaxID=3041266 RepID=UPI0034E24B24
MNGTVQKTEVAPRDVSSTLARLDKMARFYDSAFKIPGTRFRMGWDSIFGLIPGVGDLIGVAPLIYYLEVACHYNLGWGVCLRLIGNQAIDFVVGSVPLVGDLFDVGFKANLKNAEILRSRLER